MVCVERSQDSFVGLVLSFLLYVDSEGGAQVIRLAWQVSISVDILATIPEQFFFLILNRDYTRQTLENLN